MRHLTIRQQLVLDFIVAHIKKYNYPPTIREIGDHLKIRSTNGVNDHLKALERKGHIERDLTRSRGLRVVSLQEGVEGIEGDEEDAIASCADTARTIEVLTKLSVEQQQRIVQLTEQVQQQQELITRLCLEQHRQEASC